MLYSLVKGSCRRRPYNSWRRSFNKSSASCHPLARRAANRQWRGLNMPECGSHGARCGNWGGMEKNARHIPSRAFLTWHHLASHRQPYHESATSGPHWSPGCTDGSKYAMVEVSNIRALTRDLRVMPCRQTRRAKTAKSAMTCP